MKGPKQKGDQFDRGMDIEETIALMLVEVLDAAEEAGLDRDEAAAAMVRAAIAIQQGETGMAPDE